MPNLSGVTTNLYATAQEGFSTTTSATVLSGAATVSLNSTAGYTDGDIVVLVIEPASASAKQVFTGIKSGTSITSVKWTEGTNQDHAAGSTVVDYTTATHQAMQTKANLAHANADGSLKDNIVTTAKIPDGNVTPPKLSEFDWHKTIFGHNYTSQIGTWASVPASLTGNPITDKYENDGTRALNDEVNYKFVLQAGTYRLGYYSDKDVNRAIVTFSVDGTSVGTYDGYAASRVNSTYTVISSSIVIPTNKLVTLRVKATSKNASSTAHVITIYRIDLTRVS
jgi:hypothetical protein